MSFIALPTIVESDLENLLNSFENLTINNSPNMTQSVPVLKSEFLSMIPDFNVEVELLPRFIEICEKLVKRFFNTNDLQDFQNEYLMSSIRSKIKGEAALNISSIQINNWKELKESLIQAYSDKRDTYTLCLELSYLKQSINETPFEFFTKIQKNTVSIFKNQ